MKTNNPWSRREFLRTASAATLSALAAGYPRGLMGAEAPLDASLLPSSAGESLPSPSLSRESKRSA